MSEFIEACWRDIELPDMSLDRARRVRIPDECPAKRLRGKALADLSEAQLAFFAMRAPGPTGKYWWPPKQRDGWSERWIDVHEGAAVILDHKEDTK